MRYATGSVSSRAPICLNPSFLKLRMLPRYCLCRPMTHVDLFQNGPSTTCENGRIRSFPYMRCSPFRPLDHLLLARLSSSNVRCWCMDLTLILDVLARIDCSRLHTCRIIEQIARQIHSTIQDTKFEDMIKIVYAILSTSRLSEDSNSLDYRPRPMPSRASRSPNCEIFIKV
jgi:hypothetical protein